MRMSVAAGAMSAGAPARHESSGKSGTAGMAPIVRRSARRESPLPDRRATTAIIDARFCGLPFEAMCRVMSLAVAGLTCLVLASSLPAADGLHETTRWGEWVEPDFPFFSSVLDASHAGDAFPSRNLTPRALILNL